MTSTLPTHALTMALHHDGWKLHAVINGASTGTNQTAPLSIAAAEQIARVMGDATSGAQLQPTPFEIARQGNSSLKASLTQRLQEAEHIATSIPGLKQALQEANATQQERS